MRGKRMLIDCKQSPTANWIEDVRAKYPTERLVDEALTRKMRNRNTEPYYPQNRNEVAERLTKFLARRLPSSDFTISDVRTLAGGSSKEQFAFTVSYGDADRAPERYVIRLQPGESIVETHRLREFQAMRAVDQIMPVPRARWIDSTGDELGQPALILDFADGVARPPANGPFTPRLGLGAHYRGLLAPQFLQHFAALAAFDWSGADMSAFDAPAVGSSEGVIAAINGWARVWEEDAVEEYPLMRFAEQWLRQNVPPIDHVSIVHGDFRAGNFLFKPDDGRITAILDWEMAHLGDRHEDIAFLLNPMFAEKSEEGQQLAGGFMPQAELLAEYERLSGLPVDPIRLRYYQVFTGWRSAIISIASATRCALGQKTHQDIRVGWISNAAPLWLRQIHQGLALEMS